MTPIILFSIKDNQNQLKTPVGYTIQPKSIKGIAQIVIKSSRDRARGRSLEAGIWLGRDCPTFKICLKILRHKIQQILN